MNNDNTALVPVEERQVSFYGDDITAALVETNTQETVFVPLKPICDYLGLDWSAQLQRLKRDAVLSELQGMVIITTPSGGPQEMICLPLEYLNGWLFGINSSRVKADLKEKVVRYQKECYKALAQYFQAETFNFAEHFTPAPVTNVALAQIRDMGMAIVQMAEQQMEMEKRLTSRLDQAALAFKALDRRVTGIEKKLTPASLITEEQATEVSLAVKALAEYLKSKDSSKNHYQAVFSEIYRKFGVSSYKNIRADQYATVLKFLEEWRGSADK